jgi:hypothetical protein
MNTGPTQEDKLRFARITQTIIQATLQDNTADAITGAAMFISLTLDRMEDKEWAADFALWMAKNLTAWAKEVKKEAALS